jgi:hypothetical protein
MHATSTCSSTRSIQRCDSNREILVAKVVGSLLGVGAPEWSPNELAAPRHARLADTAIGRTLYTRGRLRFGQGFAYNGAEPSPLDTAKNCILLV